MNKEDSNICERELLCSVLVSGDPTLSVHGVLNLAALLSKGWVVSSEVMTKSMFSFHEIMEFFIRFRRFHSEGLLLVSTSWSG